MHSHAQQMKGPDYGGCELGSALMQIYISEDVFINAGGHSSKVVYYQNLFKQIVGSYSSVPGR